MNQRKSITELLEDLKRFKATDNVTTPDKGTMMLYAEVETLINRLDQEKDKRRYKIFSSGVVVPDEEI